jgi:hypothetical protein
VSLVEVLQDASGLVIEDRHLCQNRSR